MSAEDNNGFQQLVDLCKQTHQEMQRRIPQTMSAKSNVGEISQQSADQLPKFQANPVEFDGIKMQAAKEDRP